MNQFQTITYKGQKVITTEMLAQVYGTDSENITRNFSRNKGKFIEGKHYFYLQGKELRKFKGTRLLDGCLKYTSHLYLWTERGANHHCKILDTDKAWEQFENLEETYFRVKEKQHLLAFSPDGIKYLNGVANYLRVQRQIMKDNGCTPLEIAELDKLTCDTYGIPTTNSLTKRDPFEQLAIEQVERQKSLR